MSVQCLSNVMERHGKSNKACSKLWTTADRHTNVCSRHNAVDKNAVQSGSSAPSKEVGDGEGEGQWRKEGRKEGR